MHQSPFEPESQPTAPGKPVSTTRPFPTHKNAFSQQPPQSSLSGFPLLPQPPSQPQEHVPGLPPLQQPFYSPSGLLPPAQSLSNYEPSFPRFSGPLSPQQGVPSAPLQTYSQTPLSPISQPLSGLTFKGMPVLPQPTKTMSPLVIGSILVVVLLLLVSSGFELYYLANNAKGNGGLNIFPGNQGQGVTTNPTTGATATTGTPVGGTATAPAQNTLTNTVINPYPPHAGMLSLNTPLSSNMHKWREFTDQLGNSCQFNGGVYHVVAAGNNSIPCFATATNYQDFTYQIQMTFTKVGKQYSGGGIAFRGGGNPTQYYVFVIYESGRYTLSFCPGLNCTRVLSGYPTQPQIIPSFNTTLNQPNTLGLVAKGANFDIYVNGQHAVGPINDVTLTHGMIGVFAAGGIEGGPGATADVTFSNASVWS